MRITVEISMYPLRENYEPAIFEFIQKVKQVEGLIVKANPTATHIFGEYNLVFSTLNSEIKRSFETYGKAVFAMKVLSGDLENSLDGKNL
jgi:uncharacterized protein YqgV (UPF0045/DUF77 family)